MFDFGWAELLIVGGIALFVIGPQDIPNIAYQVGKLFRRVKYLQYALSGQFDDFMQSVEDKKDKEKKDSEDPIDDSDFDEAGADEAMAEIMPLPAEKSVIASDQGERGNPEAADDDSGLLRPDDPRNDERDKEKS